MITDLNQDNTKLEMIVVFVECLGGCDTNLAFFKDISTELPSECFVIFPGTSKLTDNFTCWITYTTGNDSEDQRTVQYSKGGYSLKKMLRQAIFL